VILSEALTPKQIVAQLDAFIVGQMEAKRAMAIALRNRVRRQKLDPSVRDEIVPKNLLMIGPTGVGKTEIARRLAKLTHAPFIKVEATKFTEVGYVGRDVESMVRDLVETAVHMVKGDHMRANEQRAYERANEHIVSLLVPTQEQEKNPFEMLFGGGQKASSTDPGIESRRDAAREQLRAGMLEDVIIDIEQTETHNPMVDFLFSQGQDGSQLSDFASKMFPKKTKKRTCTVREARPILIAEAAQQLMDQDAIHQKAIELAQQSGIIFIDEIDKIATQGRGQGPDVSREGVQRDILPIVEGCTVNTKYGSVQTDHMLFIAAGAFHMAKPSDLIPELQGRFPIRVELHPLTKNDYEAILRDPQHALTKQAIALLATEGITVSFSDEAITEIADIAYETNRAAENIGARRLHALLEKILEDIAFDAPDCAQTEYTITPHDVRQKLGNKSTADIRRYIL
jgi:ATP-dependent HslUV protease ATP-binding subunit HslU